MASSLRKRLGRRTAMPDLNNGDDDSGSSSESSLKAASAQVAKDTNGDQQPIAADDLSTTPPPPPPDRSLRSSKDFSRDRTPPQSLLEKYKSRSARDAVPTLSGASAKEKSDIVSRKDSHGGVHATSDSESAASSQQGGTRKVRGVEFDMLNQAKANAELGLRHGPTKGENKSQQQSGFQHRRTRSSARREQRDLARANSVEDALLGDELKRLQLDTGLKPPEVPRGLSIRKVERTPSPRQEEEEKKDEEEWVDVKESKGPSSTGEKTSPKKSANKTHDASARDATLNAALSNLLAIPPPAGPGAPPSPLNYSPSPTPTAKKSIIKNTSRPSTSDRDLSIPIAPPVVLAGCTAAKGYIWCSDKSTTSRPSEPWTWCKRWTCCSCGPSSSSSHDDLLLTAAGRDVLGLGGSGGEEEEGERRVNGRGERRAATTMAEQRVCCRISCGHVRCGACCVVQEAKYMTSGPFTR